ncbi:MAG: chitobiase/beta-hexosaminidase C-terminal domain-containing protein [Spirosoma sp.]|nr:chitobiase/beta-hexosaminidase C-terminal domain-containing protein [Spirosoma sp.]
MSNKIIGWAEQGLFAVSVFIGFLLLFESQLVVPVWLQPVGRMHPLLLHFPLVMLLLAVGLEAFRFGATPETSAVYKKLAATLLLAGTLLAAVAVIMGLLLSKEVGYTGEVVVWHKWAGVGVFFLATLLYWSRNKSWYSPMVARTGAVLMGLVLTGAGHYGAALTHGTDFITAPMAQYQKKVPVDVQQAVVFADVIQPIFEQKCITCHNANKLKGELALHDAASVQKGGKTGKLFVAGKPDISLLLQRIHLPMDEKKHMPPTGKAQLTPAEIRLLSLWVKGQANPGGADFNKRVLDLPASDSLRMMAVALFTPIKPAEPEFDFKAADDETVKKLNTDYRTVAFLAKESPALAVNLYNKATYSAGQLKELSAVKKQVVSLNLNKLPVKDADLTYIGQLENLQRLDLNFTDVTGKGLRELLPLKHLESLALSGTKTTYADLNGQLPNFKKLRALTLWETGITSGEIEKLRKANPGIQIIAGFDGDKSAPIRLNVPQMANNSPIFSESIRAQIIHPVKGVQIRYTTDGTEPDSINSPIFDKSVLLTKPTSINAKAYKSGWYSSPVVTFDYYKRTHKPDSATLLYPLNPVHLAAGANTFFDNRLGTFTANSPAWANNWAGFRANPMGLITEFKKPVRVSSVALRIMEEEETGIFPPEVIEIWGGTSRETLKLIATMKPEQPTQKRPHLLKAITCTFAPQTVSYLKIFARPVSKIPDWHASKGGKALLLVDEVLIN